MTTQHHAESVDLGEHGFIEVTRDDTDELQDYHLVAWKNGRIVQETRVIYNIQYDYFRRQEWLRGKLTYDSLISNDGYGHLLYEFNYGLYGPEGWVPSMDENGWEPVTPLGAQIFREEGTGLSITLVENMICADICFYDLKYYEKWRLPAKLLDDVRIMDKPHNHWVIDNERQYLRWHFLYRRGRLCPKRLHPLWHSKVKGSWSSYSWVSQIKRARFFKEQSKEIQVEVPIDPRMVFNLPRRVQE